MKDPSHIGVLGGLLAALVGFVIGGLFYLSMRLQVEYVVHKRGPEWLMPALMYARLIAVAVVLVLVLKVVGPGYRLAESLLLGLFGGVVARVLVGRMVKKPDKIGSEGDA
ncbi:MAG: hypothetical protein JXR37_32805 [Kiritimatiellae bacterium]|nr:hypothetical protein [Kiritimatiellia bacterium]